MSLTLERPAGTPPTELRRLALDLTRKCQANCGHCYNGSGPQGEHGEMTGEDWWNLLDQAAAVGVKQVQFIGGEPTLRRELPDLINRAVDLGMRVEVFSNLIYVRPGLWPALRQRGVTLATSYYSDQADEHEHITKHRGSYAKTKANIVKALGYRIPVRAAIVHTREGQRTRQAAAELRALGVTNIRFDKMRAIGRGAGTDDDGHDVNELCGHCTRGRAAVLPDGSVAGCVMSGAMTMIAGNVRTTELATIVTGPEWAAIAAAIPLPPGRWRRLLNTVRRAIGRPAGDVHGGCTPDEDSCQPSPGVGPVVAAGGHQLRRLLRAVGGRTATACNPNQDGEDCAPAETEACGPKY